MQWKNVKISEYNWKKIKEFEGGLMDTKLNNLIDSVEDKMPIINYSEKTKNVKCYPSTMDRLDGFKISLGESRDNIITRMIMIHEGNDIAELEIPIRLSSPLNKELVLYCFITPSSIVKADDNDSLEFKAWEKLLNWNEIRELTLNHSDEIISFNKPNYRIDINYEVL